jgi:hypothetical protein
MFGLMEAEISGPASTGDQMLRAKRAGLEWTADPVALKDLVDNIHAQGARVHGYIGSIATNTSPTWDAAVRDTVNLLSSAGFDAIGFDATRDIGPPPIDELYAPPITTDTEWDIWHYKNQEEIARRTQARRVVNDTFAMFDETIIESVPLDTYRPPLASWLCSLRKYLQYKYAPSPSETLGLAGIVRPVYCIVPSDSSASGLARIQRDIVDLWGVQMQADPNFVDFTTAGLSEFARAEGLLPMNYNQDFPALV